MAHNPFFSYAPLLLFCIIVIFKLIPNVIPKPPNGFSLQLIHRYSPHSRLYVQNLSTPQIISRQMKSSNLSEESESDIDTQRLRFELARDDNVAFLVKLHFGNPAIPLYLLPDTGSHLFWTQCEPCTRRYRQRSPIYNSTASHSYLKLPCEHRFCRSNNSTFHCVNGECVYRQRFASGDTTIGVAASEVFQPFENTQRQIFFGCSKDNRNFPTFEHTGMIGGIMGLSMSPVSLLHQLANITQHRFSYCLPPYNSRQNVTTLLRFGNDVTARGRRFTSTPIITPPTKYKYFLNLQDISVEDHRMNFPPNTFAMRQGGNSGGVIIDTGTSVTRIVEHAFRPLIRAFQAYFDHFGLERVHLPETGLELCYKNSKSLPKLAGMTYHFEGADFEVKPNYMYWVTRDREAFCVELFSSENRTVLGAMQQINTRFIFDAAARLISFSPEDCEG